ncbi:hypothetical protein PIB30_063246 [Stylosanthes scabra]|uniref:Uncharacterized protein n=1 Tax=Stylosanthes scabra TaxID=79078 RepID=A0ABU6YIV4_9FABA|nr:hypothetical protein [Stylosanthes scabra]
MAPKRRSAQEIEMEELRRQVKELQKQLARYEAAQKDRGRMSDHSSSDEEYSNPFYDSFSSEDLPTHKTRHGSKTHYKAKDLGIKVDIPEFEGRFQPDDSLTGFAQWSECSS